MQGGREGRRAPRSEGRFGQRERVEVGLGHRSRPSDRRRRAQCARTIAAHIASSGGPNVNLWAGCTHRTCHIAEASDFDHSEIMILVDQLVAQRYEPAVERSDRAGVPRSPLAKTREHAKKSMAAGVTGAPSLVSAIAGGGGRRGWAAGGARSPRRRPCARQKNTLVRAPAEARPPEPALEPAQLPDRRGGHRASVPRQRSARARRHTRRRLRRRARAAAPFRLRGSGAGSGRRARQRQPGTPGPRPAPPEHRVARSQPTLLRRRHASPRAHAPPPPRPRARAAGTTRTSRARASFHSSRGRAAGRAASATWASVPRASMGERAPAPAPALSARARACACARRASASPRARTF